MNTRQLILIHLLGLFLVSGNVICQGLTGIIVGVVTDKESGIPLPGVNISAVPSGKGCSTDSTGHFILDGIQVGRVDLRFSMIGYEASELRNLVVSSGRYLQVQVDLQEKVEVLDEVVVKAFTKDKPLNPMATVSARSFSVDETERYAGSLGDPSRMAANYAGVVVAGDQRNDIIIRGNSPTGLLWKLDGMTIPNPNHFGTMGTTGGPISILNNNQLDNSDFFTGAFPAEYGNALSGVFDLRLRNGNDLKREYLVQAGMNGFEAGAEGPLGKKNVASFLLNYRYTMLSLMKAMGIFNVDGVPVYQDLSSKINIPTLHAGTFTLQVLGGESHIDVGEAGESSWTVDMPDSTRATYRSGMQVAGISHRIFLSEKARIESILSYTGSFSAADLDTLIMGRFNDYYKDDYHEKSLSFASRFSVKQNALNTFQSGVQAEIYFLNFHDEVYNKQLKRMLHPTKTNEYTVLYQAFSQWKKRWNENITSILGVHSQMLSLNQSIAFEPRAGIRLNLSSRQSLGLGYGLHSQMQPRLVYFLRTLVDTTQMLAEETNRNLGFSKSHQLVFSYDLLLTTNLRLKLESYYQYLCQIPVEQKSSVYSLANYGARFYNSKVDSLVNRGKGRNYGIECTLEKFLSHNYYFLLTASLYESKYQASDHQWRNTEFNGNFTFNALAGYEKQIKNSTLSVNIRTVWAGGKRYIPLDESTSRSTGKTVYDYGNAYSNRFADYFRMDIRISWKLNQKRISQEWSADIQNISNHKNILTQDFNSATLQPTYTYQMVFFPVGAWRVYF
ncbi:MAG: carboxypeptidase-like regulatory domain-containing protein [Bacteroidales bacterium]